MSAPLAVSEPAPVTGPPTGTSWLVRRPRRSTLVSFEVFPPRPTADPDTVWRNIDAMAQAGPDFFSVTHGHAGHHGGSREALRHLRRTTKTPVMAHFTCGGTDRAGLERAVDQLLDDGVRDLLALLTRRMGHLAIKMLEHHELRAREPFAGTLEGIVCESVHGANGVGARARPSACVESASRTRVHWLQRLSWPADRPHHGSRSR